MSSHPGLPNIIGKIGVPTGTCGGLSLQLASAKNGQRIGAYSNHPKRSPKKQFPTQIVVNNVPVYFGVVMMVNMVIIY